VRSVVALIVASLTSLQAIGPQTRDVLPTVKEREALLAFRLDSRRVVATIKGELNLSIPQLARGASERPAKYGYHIFNLPAALETGVPAWIRTGDRWTLRVAPGQTFNAVVERFVLGEGQCSRLLGVVMKIGDREAQAFSRVRSNYYLVESASRGGVADDPLTAFRSGSPLGELPASAVSRRDRKVIAKTLTGLVGRELPKVRADAEEQLIRHASSGDRHLRAWARTLLDAEENVIRGAALSFDAQPYQLTPGSVPHIFVRAFWRVRGHQVFAAALWIRAGEVVRSDFRPAAWLRMSLFQGGLVPEQLGQVLNVVDRDRDGWAEIIVGHVGYEGRGISLLDVRSGFTPTGVEYGYGC
jgi:hypothetical protein